MTGITLEFKCKNCGAEHEMHLGVTQLYKINDNECDYTPLSCHDCDKLQYVALNAIIIDEDNEESKVKEFEKVKDIVGDSEKSKEWFFKHVNFIIKDKATILESEVHSMHAAGFVLY